MALSSLPYDLLLNIAQYLSLDDIRTLQRTSKSLRTFSTTRPVYRTLANALLRRCRALPLLGFKRISDLSTDDLRISVQKAIRLENAWQVRAPRLLSHSVLSAPPCEDVDWLSPISSSYTLCATKSGKVICWDVASNAPLAQWDPGPQWELWKCRVEFEDRTIFFTTARVLNHSYNDERIMKFQLISLRFSEHDNTPPVFTHISTFTTAGVVMNIFLLDPPSRLLSAFVWVAAYNTIALYVRLDWDVPEYVFINTGIDCGPSSNWSCILFDSHLVIHAEESDAVLQYFYPLSLLQQYARPLTPDKVPTISVHLSPPISFYKRFIFPPPSPSSSLGFPNPNPFPSPVWYPESAHFVRQWWPTLPSVPKLSCTVILLTTNDRSIPPNSFVLVQHYFRVPMSPSNWSHYKQCKLPSPSSSTNTIRPFPGIDIQVEYEHSYHFAEKPNSDRFMKLWYVSAPLNVVCVSEPQEQQQQEQQEQDDTDNNNTPTNHQRPLVAVDFGHAAWIEHMDPDRDRSVKAIRFVTFPPVRDIDDDDDETDEEYDEQFDRGGIVRTLGIPDELDLESVETINIDQSQGAVILSAKDKIFILTYD